MKENDATGAEAGTSLDNLVLAVARQRDRVAFAALFGYYAPRLKYYLIRQGADAGTAEELVQEVMLTVWRRADSFDPKQAGASTWVFTIVRNKRIDGLRNERRPEIDFADPSLIPDADPSAHHQVESAEEAKRLREAIATLPPEQVEMLRMAYFEDKPHGEIAAERNMPLGTVKSRLRLALDRLRRVLREETEP
ncbi:ECF RNA polymerase sigma factor RpoE [uncultured Gammaproteobacteria bacterium]